MTTQADLEAIHAKILAEPSDATARLAYADAALEVGGHDNEERAAFIHLMYEASRRHSQANRRKKAQRENYTVEGGSRVARALDKRDKTLRAAGEILARNEAWARTAVGCRVQYYDAYDDLDLLRDLVHDWWLGFLTRIEAYAAGAFACGPALVARHPLRRIRLLPYIGENSQFRLTIPVSFHDVNPRLSETADRWLSRPYDDEYFTDAVRGELGFAILKWSRAMAGFDPMFDNKTKGETG